MGRKTMSEKMKIISRIKRCLSRVSMSHHFLSPHSASNLMWLSRHSWGTLLPRLKGANSQQKNCSEVWLKFKIDLPLLYETWIQNSWYLYMSFEAKKYI